MTITSLDNFGHASGSISMSELRDYYGKSGSVSLGLNLSGTDTAVPSHLPLYTQTLSFSDYRSKNRILKKKGTTETVDFSYISANGTTWTPAQSGCVQYNVYVVGGGGSGGGHSTDSGREKVASGGGGGGTAFRRYSVQDHGITSATVTWGSQAAGVSYAASSGAVISGNNGGDITFNPNGSGATISATGGSRGFGGRQGLLTDTVTSTAPVGEASTSTSHGAWGQCASSVGGTGSGGENNYTGGIGTGFNVGSDQSRASGGGGPNLGSGAPNGEIASGSGYVKGATTSAPTYPTEWGTDIANNQFLGGAGVQHSSGAAGASDAGGYGSGSGGSASESGAGSSRFAGAPVNVITYYEINT